MFSRDSSDSEEVFYAPKIECRKIKCLRLNDRIDNMESRLRHLEKIILEQPKNSENKHIKDDGDSHFALMKN